MNPTKEEMQKYIGDLYKDREGNLILIIKISDNSNDSFDVMEMSKSNEMTCESFTNIESYLYTKVC